MPELPEVKTIVNVLRKENLPGDIILKISLFKDKQFPEGENQLTLNKKIVNKKIKKIESKGKWILFFLKNE